MLLAVLWENLADPILTGREQIGFAKVYAEIPAPIIRGSETRLGASWLGFRFSTSIGGEDYSHQRRLR